MVRFVCVCVCVCFCVCVCVCVTERQRERVLSCFLLKLRILGVCASLLQPPLFVIRETCKKAATFFTSFLLSWWKSWPSSAHHFGKLVGVIHDTSLNLSSLSLALSLSLCVVWLLCLLCIALISICVTFLFITTSWSPHIVLFALQL